MNSFTSVAYVPIRFPQRENTLGFFVLIQNLIQISALDGWFEIGWALLKSGKGKKVKNPACLIEMHVFLITIIV